MTLAGTLTQANAEFLGALALCQAVQPGIPVIYTQWTRSLDMASGSVAMGGPEFSLLRVATAEMARYYDLPSRGGGLMTDAKAADAQMGMEKMLNCLMSSLAGLNVVAGVGQTDFINTVRPDQMLIDNEIISLVKRMCRGIKVNEDTMALDAISQVGPGGNYLTTDHTVANFRQELWFPRCSTVRSGPFGKQKAPRILQPVPAKKCSAKQSVPPLEAAVSQGIWISSLRQTGDMVHKPKLIKEFHPWKISTVKSTLFIVPGAILSQSLTMPRGFTCTTRRGNGI